MTNMMKNIEQKIVAKISEAPAVWLLCIVGFFGIFGGLGLVVNESTASANLAITGLAMGAVSFIGILATLHLYLKHDLASDEVKTEQ